MRYRQLGNTYMNTSVIAMGSWAIGGGKRWGDNDDALSERTVRAAVERGINLIDTAPAYGRGHSEEVVGRALKGIRDKVYLSTKCGQVWDGREGTYFFEQDGIVTRKNLSAASVMQECDESLTRLGTDYIDIYITHWQSVPPFFTPIEETMGALTKLKAQGKIRAIGASNVTPEHIREYMRCGGIDLIQEKYSLLDRKNGELLSLCKEYDITFQAYSPLEMGLLTGKLPNAFVPERESAREGKYWFEPQRLQAVNAMLSGWEDLREKYGASTAQLVISCTADVYEKMSVLCGARKPFQLEENAGGGFELEKADRERIFSDIEKLSK